MADETDTNPLVAELVADTATEPAPVTLESVSEECARLIHTLPPEQRQLVVKAIRGEFGG